MDIKEGFRPLTSWNKERDNSRRIFAEKFLKENDIEFTIPSVGCYKLTTVKQATVMFYPKSGKIIWKKDKADKQHHFVNKRPEKILKHLRNIL